MSDFGEALFELLPVHSSLQNQNNQGRKVLDDSVGEWFDHHNVDDFYEQLFLDSCTGAYLDLFGRDYGIIRQLNESDEDYRVRIVQEKNDRLTPSYLKSVYGLTLYHAIGGFSTADNTLTSDNPYSTDYYMGVLDENVKKILDNKFIMDNIIVWYDGTPLDCIITTSNVDILNENLKVYTLDNLQYYFTNNTSVEKIRLTLPNCTGGAFLFADCSNLTDLYLDIPNATVLDSLMRNCNSLVNIEINMAKGYFTNIDYFFPPSLSTLKTAIWTVPSSLKSAFISKFSNKTDYPNIEYLCVNGEEVDLS